MARLDWSKARYNKNGTEPAFPKVKPVGYIKRDKPIRNTVLQSDLFEVTTSPVTRIYFDGGCAPNPGRMSSCIVICQDGEKPKALTMDDLGYGTNNVAEWSALVWAATWAKDNGIKQAVMIGDSQLVIKQASGSWKINNELLSDLFKQFQEASQGIELTFSHVLRDSNLAGRYLEHGYV